MTTGKEVVNFNNPVECQQPTLHSGIVTGKGRKRFFNWTEGLKLGAKAFIAYESVALILYGLSPIFGVARTSENLLSATGLVLTSAVILGCVKGFLSKR